MTKKQRVFISFHHRDIKRARGFRLLNANPNTEVDFIEESFIEPVKSTNQKYIKERIEEKIERSDVAVVLIGDHTANSDWVDYEVEYAYQKDKPVIGIHLKDQRGKVPPALEKHKFPVVDWEPGKFQEVIQRAGKQVKAVVDSRESDPSGEHC